MKFTSPKKSGLSPQTGQSPTKKPAVPPKPRNVVVSRRKSQKIEEDPNEQNDSGLSGKPKKEIKSNLKGHFGQFWTFWTILDILDNF